MLLHCTPTKNAKQFGSLSGLTFLSVSSLTGVTALWLICAISLYSFFRIYAWVYGTVKRQNNAKQTEEIKKNKHHAKKNEETK